MKIEAGKYYRTRDGRKVGPMENVAIGSAFTANSMLWSEFGDFCGDVNGGICYQMKSNPDQDLIAEWQDEPTLWRDMTPEEKGALLLAKYEGKVIDTYVHPVWVSYQGSIYHGDAYRIRPEPVKPREFWVGDGYCFDNPSAARLAGVYDATHVREVIDE